MSENTYQNNHSLEGTLASTTETLTFPWPLLELQITNDSLTDNLQFRFSTNENYRTLYPKETCRLENVRLRDLHINSSASVAYRIWGLG